MELQKVLEARSGGICELCGGDDGLSVYAVPPYLDGGPDKSLLSCALCLSLMDQPDKQAHHWRCLNESMWSQEAPVQVMSRRLLHRLSDHDWARDLAEMLFLDEETLAWAKSTEHDGAPAHVDCNGSVLKAGDTVTLIKDLKVKGAKFTAKRGTVVRGISPDPDNPEHIEGRVNGQHIVILTKFVKKSS